MAVVDGVQAETESSVGQSASEVARAAVSPSLASTLGPPALMCAIACATVLASAGYRCAGLDGLRFEPFDLAELTASQTAMCEPADVVCEGFESPDYIVLAAAMSDATDVAGSAATAPSSHDAAEPVMLASARTARDFEEIIAEQAQRPPSPRAADGSASTHVAALARIAALEDDQDLHTVPHLRAVNHRIRNGESLIKVLDAAGVAPTEVGAWVRAADAYYDLDRLHAGQAVSYLIDMQSRGLRQLAIEIDTSDMLVAEWAGGAGVEVRRQAIPVERRLRVTTGKVRADFKTAARLAGAPEPVFAQVADVLGWEIDVGTDVGRGARFRIAYEERTRGASEPTYQLLAVQVEGRADWHEAYYFAGRGKRAAGYYDRRGRAFGARFLRYPVEYTRISSRFAERRFHPVLRIPRPHYGVDFAAPTGTPVRAVAPGVITRAGWHNANGRFVKIRHGGAFDTGYAHLARIAPGITTGAHVHKGQTIGYVGSSGLATGPHLHFAMYREGRYVDPFKVELPRARTLAGARLTAFRLARTRMERALMDADPVERGPIVTASAKF